MEFPIKPIIKNFETRIIEGTRAEKQKRMSDALYKHCKASSDQLDKLCENNPAFALTIAQAFGKLDKMNKTTESNEQYMPRTAQELDEFETLMLQTALENEQNAKNGKFLVKFFLVIGLLLAICITFPPVIKVLAKLF